MWHKIENLLNLNEISKAELALENPNANKHTQIYFLRAVESDGKLLLERDRFTIDISSALNWIDLRKVISNIDLIGWWINKDF